MHIEKKGSDLVDFIWLQTIGWSSSLFLQSDIILISTDSDISIVECMERKVKPLTGTDPPQDNAIDIQQSVLSLTNLWSYNG